MAIVHVTTKDFEQQVLQAQLPVLVDFWAEWCGPCRMLAPILEEVAAEQEGKAIIAKVNIDEEMDLAARFGIASIPTMLVFKNGQLVKRTVGLQPKGAVEALLA